MALANLAGPLLFLLNKMTHIVSFVLYYHYSNNERKLYGKTRLSCEAACVSATEL